MAGLDSVITESAFDARRRFTKAVVIVFRPARSNRMDRRWQGLPSCTAPAADATVPTPHSGLPGWSTRSPIWNLSWVAMVIMKAVPAGK